MVLMCSGPLGPDHDDVVRNVSSALAAALVAVGLGACGGANVRDEEVSLAAVRDAVVVSGGAERGASDGATLKKGDRVRTGSAGSATLVVRDRKIVLAASTEVVVPDGATVDLARGALLVDRRRGPGVTVHAGDTTVDEIATGALRVERRLTVLVAAFAGRSRVSTATGQRMDVGALHQVAVAGRALPSDAAPLQLRHDDWERGVLPRVLADDTRLNALAAGLDGPRAIVPVAYRPAAGIRTSDVLLADAIARAARKNAAEARGLRERGGSWGVVAALLGTSAIDVGASLDGVLAGTPAQQPGQPGQPSTGPTGVVAGPTPGPVTRPTPTPSSQPQPRPSGSTGPPRPSTSPSPSPSTSPSQSLDDVIRQIIPTPSIAVPALPLLP
jgi:hypothetical protein